MLKNACISGLAHSYQALDAPTSHDATSFQFDEKEVTFQIAGEHHFGSGRRRGGGGENDTENDLTESDFFCDEIDHSDSSPSSPRPPTTRKMFPRDSVPSFNASLSTTSFTSTLSDECGNVSPRNIEARKEKEKEKEKREKRMSTSLKKTMHNYLISPSQSSPTHFSQISPLPPSFLDPKLTGGKGERERGERGERGEGRGGGEGVKGKGKSFKKALSVGNRYEADFLLPPPSFSFSCEDVKSITMFVVCLFPHWNVEISNFLASFAQFGISEVHI